MKNKTSNNSVQNSQNGPSKKSTKTIQKIKEKILSKVRNNNNTGQNRKLLVEQKNNNQKIISNLIVPENHNLIIPLKPVVQPKNSVPVKVSKNVNNQAPKKDPVLPKPKTPQQGDGFCSILLAPKKETAISKLPGNVEVSKDAKKLQEPIKNNQASSVQRQNSIVTNKKSAEAPKKIMETKQKSDVGSAKGSSKPTSSKEKRKDDTSLEKVAQDMVKVLSDLRNSINLMKSSVNKDSYSDVVPQLEEMCQKNEAIFHKTVVEKPKSSSNSNNKLQTKAPPQQSQQQQQNNNMNKINTNAVTNSSNNENNKKNIVAVTKLKGSNMSNKSLHCKVSQKSTRDSLLSREYYNPLGMIKDEVDQAVKNRKTFSIRGNFQAVRKALLCRGWIEKYLIRVNEELRKYQNYSITELLELLRNKEIYEICKKTIKSKLLQNHQVDLFWDHSYDAFKECSDNVKLTLINKFRRDVFSYTSKQGLCEAAKDSYWFQIPGVSNINHPRSYTLTKTGDTKGFIKDFNLTAAMSLMKWIVKNSVTKECKILSESGKIPLKVFAFAVTECYKLIKQLNHEDIDNVIEDALDYDWHEFLEYFYKTVHVGNHFRAEEGATEHDMVRKAKFLLNILKDKWPYLEMDGMMNIWILKPTNGSRGIGIHICRTMEYILNIVKKNPNRRYIIQKYIEKPFLIHDTKFDIRQWFLISSSNPLTIWMYKLCYLRFSSETYNLRKLHESIHLTNNSVQCRYQKNVKKTIILPVYNMWDSRQFKAYLSDIGYPKAYQDVIYPGMKESITAAVLMHQDKIDKRKNCFELYGADFILTEDFKPWLLEINSNPALHSSTPVTSKMCPQVLEDVVKVVIDFDRNPKANTGNFELIYKQTVVSQPKINDALELSGVPIQETYFDNETTLTELPETQLSIKKFSWTDLSKQLEPCCNLKLVGETVRNTLESLIKLLKNEKLKRQQRKSKSVETRSLCCVLEKTHIGTQTLLEQLFDGFLNAQDAMSANKSKKIMTSNVGDDSTLVNTIPLPFDLGQNIILEEVKEINGDKIVLME